VTPPIGYNKGATGDKYWKRVRLNRMLVDHLLREGMYDTAKMLSEDLCIKDLTNVDVMTVCLHYIFIHTEVVLSAPIYSVFNFLRYSGLQRKWKNHLRGTRQTEWSLGVMKINPN